MITFGMSYWQRQDFHNLLASNHEIEISVSMTTLSGTRLSDLTPAFLDGQINIDGTQPITRGGTLSFLDPNHKMGLDAASPSDGAMFADRMLQVYYVVKPPDMSRQFVCPVFCGPITKVDRDWVSVSVEVQGKESLGLGSIWKPKTYKKGAKKTDVIRDILRNQMGEVKYQIPDLASRLPSDLALNKDTKPWSVCRSVAASLGYQLFYDGRGVAVMRPYQRTAVWTYHDRTGGTVTTKPEVGHDLSNLVNAVRVIGQTTKGKKKVPLVYNVFAPSTSPYNAWALGRNGVPRYLWDEIEDDSINTKAEAKAVGEARLAKGLLDVVDVSFNAMPVPHLEPGDVYRLTTEEFTTTATLQKMAIPLSASASSTVGYLRNVRPNARNVRRNRR